MSTVSIATARNTLFNSKALSRDISSGFSGFCSDSARKAKSSKDPPITTSKNIRMYSPRSGSTANACTEVSTPERTKKVPIKLKEKVPIAKSTVHALNCPRFSLTMSECNNAVPSNHGMNDAFSTGSQNHQPPQPSSR